MFRSIPAALGCIVSLAMTSVAEAQLVRVGRYGGGVSVRVPFVSVDVLPYGGGTRVRAPFTSVNTGAYRYGYGYPAGYAPYYAPAPVYRSVPVYPAPVYPAPVYPAPVYPEVGYVQPEPNPYQSVRPASSDSLPDRLIASAQQLKRSLSVRRDDSDIWLDYLGPDRIIATIERGESPGSLRALLTNYDGVVGNPDLSSISRANGFRQTHQLLRSFVDSPPAASSTRRVESPASNGDSILVPSPDAGTDGPTLAPAVKPADDEKEAEVEELPVPPPVPTPL